MLELEARESIASDVRKKMSIVSEIEKLTSLRDGGKLSEEEFARAKKLLLAEDSAGSSLTEHEAKDELACASKVSQKERNKFLFAILMTLTAGMSSVSAIIAPSALSILAALLFVISSTLSWASYAKLRKLSGE